MKILNGNQWKDIPLDYSPLDSELVVFVTLMINIASASDAYFRRSNNFRLVWNYINEIGLKATLTKIISRRREGARNAKFLSIGLGFVDRPEGCKPVVFVAPLHPECADTIC